MESDERRNKEINVRQNPGIKEKRAGLKFCLQIQGGQSHGEGTSPRKPLPLSP